MNGESPDSNAVYLNSKQIVLDSFPLTGCLLDYMEQHITINLISKKSNVRGINPFVAQIAKV
jgi:hypothetical protein